MDEGFCGYEILLKQKKISSYFEDKRIDIQEYLRDRFECGCGN
jgi:hypothetical protein